MKRGWWLLLVTFIMSLPVVSARNSSIVGLFLGTEDNSIFFLRVIYFMLLFIILYNVTRKVVFKEENENKQATMFVLAFSLIAEHVTPDAWITSFGWILTILGPILIFWWVMGLFFKNRAEDAGFNWSRLILTIVAYIAFLLIAAGSLGFSKGIGSLPGLGPWLDEILSEMNYFLFYGISPLILGLVVAGILGMIMFAVMRRGEDGERRRIWPFILLAIGILILLISTAQGGMGWLSSDFLEDWWIVVVILGIITLLVVALWPLINSRWGDGEGISGRVILWIILALIILALVLAAVFGYIPWQFILGVPLLLLIIYLLYLLFTNWNTIGDFFRSVPGLRRWLWIIVGLIALFFLGYWLWVSGLIPALLSFLAGLPWQVWAIIGAIILVILIFMRPRALRARIRVGGRTFVI